ncbi:hypothetical protein RRG08_033927 [Elysia crispata]|uniref:Uncharacterized protein n=1 Tax=Elysia crispata TaxID=231223 RepID=A0AAE1B8H6_9GAST|nr:hypothetical protein RRG08_033927 [Elysia crispata]
MLSSTQQPHWYIWQSALQLGSHGAYQITPLSLTISCLVASPGGYPRFPARPRSSPKPDMRVRSASPIPPHAALRNWHLGIRFHPSLTQTSDSRYSHNQKYL